MKLLNNEEIKKELVKIWKEDQKMIDYCINKYYYYQLEDGYILEFEKKPSINKTLWYDDEQEAPALTEQYFINYNKNNLMDEMETETYLKPYIIRHYDNINCNIVSINKALYYADYEDNKEWAKNRNLYIKDLTVEEIQDINNIISELNNKYITRLKDYFKRYKNNIRVSGYWVNR